jgi:hypothetical protein
MREEKNLGERCLGSEAGVNSKKAKVREKTQKAGGYGQSGS